MVGIVVVSHSKKISEGICELALQMSIPGQYIISAGGIGEDRFGTDAFRISSAIIEANTGDGVLVLVDLGSALISTRLAIELLEGKVEVIVADAPLVEGTIIAVIEAASGINLQAVASCVKVESRLSKF
jgi:PTS hybrid protein